MVKLKDKNEYAENAKKMAAYEERIKKAAQAEAEKIKAEDPDFAREFAVKKQIKCYKKKPPQYYKKVIDRILIYLFREGGEKRTQTSILEDVRDDLTEFDEITPNVWTKKLEIWELEQVSRIVNDRMARPVNLKGCETLAALKDRLKSYHQAKAVDQAYKPVIAISDTAVLLHNENFPIIQAKHPFIWVEVNGKRQRLRVDVLKTFIES